MAESSVVSSPIEPKDGSQVETKAQETMTEILDNTVYIYTNYKISIIKGVPFGVCTTEMFGKYQPNSLTRGFPLTNPTPIRCAAWALLMAAEFIATSPEMQKLIQDGIPLVVSTPHPLLDKISPKNKDSVLKRIPSAIASLPKGVVLIHCGTDSDKKKTTESSTVTVSTTTKSGTDSSKPSTSTTTTKKVDPSKKKKKKAASSASSFANSVSISAEDKDLLNSTKVELKDPKKERERIEDNDKAKKVNPSDIIRQTLEQDKIIADLFRSGARGGRKIPGKK